MRKANAAAFDLSGDFNDIMYIEATRPIAAGEEIFFDYGKEYWDSRFARWDPRRWAIDYL